MNVLDLENKLAELWPSAYLDQYGYRFCIGLGSVKIQI